MERPAAPSSDRPLRLALALAALTVAGAWGLYVSRGAHLLHFDAKAHLVVARRTIDSLTPGWTQLGAIWLPLPHMVNALPAQVDALYTTGLFASALSFVCFLGGIAALGYAVRRATGDVWAGVVAAAVPALNPGWLYLQSTPLIEALFLGTTSVALAALIHWHTSPTARALWTAVAASALACWVRYEAWPLMALAMAWTTTVAPANQRRRIAAVTLGAGVAVPILAYGIHSWAAMGIPFFLISSDNLTERRGDLVRALRMAAEGTWQAFGGPLVSAGLAALVVRARRVPQDAVAALAWAALAPLAVTLTAYLAGHPPKARYALLLVPAFALGLAAATAHRRALQAVALTAAALQLVTVPHPLPVLREATRDRAAVAERLPVLDAFRRQYAGGRILASMGSLAPVMYELNQYGIPLREMVHEGNGSFWEDAVVDPEREVEWIVIAKGDVLDRVRQVRRRFPEGYVAVLGFRGVSIYRRGNDIAGMTGVTAGPPALGVIN